MEIGADDVDALALGCDLLGSGGGGATTAARFILTHHLAGRTVPVVDQLTPEAFVTCVGAVGSSEIMLESLPGPLPFVRAARTLEGRLRPVEAVLPLEVGGVNGLLAVLAAAALGRPLVDADPMGRAYTQLHRSVLGMAVPLTALAFSNTAGGSAYFEAPDGSVIERMVRSILPSVGGWGAVACHAGTHDRITASAVGGSVSRALSLGRALAEAVSGHPEAFRSLDDLRVEFEGTVIDVTRRTGMEVGGVASLRHQRTGLRFGRIDFANEYVAVFDNGRPTVCAPDIICVLDQDTWLPVPVDRLAPQHRVRVISIAAPPPLRAAHEAAGCFGLRAHRFAPVEATA